MAARVPRQVKQLVERTAMVVALVTGLAVLWVAGQPMVPVVTFLAVVVLVYGAFQYAMTRVLSKKKSKARRRPARV